MGSNAAVRIAGRHWRIRWWFVLTFALAWLAGCSDFWVDPTLNSIVVTDSKGITTPSVDVGVNDQMQAIGVYSDNSRGPITAAWSSSAPSVATVDNNGMVVGVAPGTATITAANAGITGTASLTVCGTQQTITISPPNQSIALGSGTTQFTASAGGVDVTKSVTWASSSPAVATISNSAGTNGVATLVGKGTTTITANSCSVTASVTLTVT